MNTYRLLAPLTAAAILGACASRGDVRLNSSRIADLESRVNGIAASLEPADTNVIVATPIEAFAPSSAPLTFDADSLIADRPDRKPDFVVWFKRASDEVDSAQTKGLNDFLANVGPNDRLTLLGTNGGNHAAAREMAGDRVTAAAALLNGRTAEIAAARYEPDQPGRRVLVWLDRDASSELTADAKSADDETMGSVSDSDMTEKADEMTDEVADALTDEATRVAEKAE